MMRGPPNDRWGRRCRLVLQPWPEGSSLRCRVTKRWPQQRRGSPCSSLRVSDRPVDIDPVAREPVFYQAIELRRSIRNRVMAPGDADPDTVCNLVYTRLVAQEAGERLMEAVAFAYEMSTGPDPDH